MTVKIIACEVMKEELLAIAPRQPVEYEFVSMGLHLHPPKLHRYLQEILDRARGYAQIVLAFGLCGGAAGGLTAGDSPLIMPRVHDCIPLLLGAHHAAGQGKGTFYLSCGWMAGEGNILAEYRRIADKYGVIKAERVFNRMFNAYHSVLFISTGCARESVYREQSRQLAALLRLSHQTVKGDHTYLHKIVHGPWNEPEFIHLAPFTSLAEEMFGPSPEPGHTGAGVAGGQGQDYERAAGMMK